MQGQGLIDGDETEILTPEKLVRRVFETVLTDLVRNDDGTIPAAVIESTLQDEIAIAKPTLACGSSGSFYGEVASLRERVAENVLTDSGY